LRPASVHAARLAAGRRAGYNPAMLTTTAATFLPPVPVDPGVLGLFHPALGSWFRATFGTPTPVQALAWPALARGSNLLISAPTGLGKTLAAFLPLLNELLPDPTRPGRGWRVGGRLRVLYLSPLKALTSDVARNLRSHLDGIASHLPTGTPLPALAVRH